MGLLLTCRAVAQQPVKVDDGNVYSTGNPNGIHFGRSGWNTTNPRDANRRYESTYTWSNTVGSHLIFFFRGTAISHYADKWLGCGPVGVSIDGQPYTNYTWTDVNASVFLFQQQMWTISGLSPGDHQVVISNTGTGGPAESYMGVDYLEVTPGPDGSIFPTQFGPGASEIPSTAVLVDDASDLISYSGSWQVYNSDINIGLFFDGTEHTSHSQGAAITFKFNGTAVWYFSDQRVENTVVTISIDGAAGETVNTASSSNVRLTQIPLWNKTDLSAGPHTLTITHAGADNELASVDFFKYLPSSPSQSSPAASNIATSSTKSISTAAIVGGVMGGIALIACIAGFLIWKWRRRRAQDVPTPGNETLIDDVRYTGKEPYAHPYAYAQGPPGVFIPLPTTNYQNNGMYPPAQNLGGLNSNISNAWTGTTYTGHPEMH